MRDIDRRFSVWLTGYYEDFQTARVVAEGEDYSTATDLYTNRAFSHAGNPMAMMAYNNPRFTFDYLSREGFYPISHTLVGLSSFSGITATMHNEGPSQWLTTDQNRLSFLHWEGRAQLTYPDTIGDAASIKTEKQPRRADYSLLASGWGTQNRLWVRQGDTDSTYGHSRLTVTNSAGNPYGSLSKFGYAKYEVGAADTGAPQNGWTFSKMAHSSNIAGVFMGEQVEASATNPTYGEYSYAHLHPIKSPSGKPFFVHRHSRRVTDWVDFSSIGNSGGFKNYVIPDSAFVYEGSLGSDDVWFMHRSEDFTSGISGSVPAGTSTVYVPMSAKIPLDPTDPRTLPNDSAGTPTHTIVIDGDSYEYNAASVFSGSTWEFTLNSPATRTYSIPSPVTVAVEDYAMTTSDTQVTIYNVTTAGSPNLENVLPLNPESTTASKMNVFRVDPTGPTAWDNGINHTNTEFIMTSDTTRGYTVYKVTLSLSLESNFTLKPEWNISGGPFANMFPRGGRLRVGDYIMVQAQTTPEKITTFSGSNITTDAAWSANVSGRLRLATYGSFDLSEGRPLDGMHGYEAVIVGDNALNANANGERFTIRMAVQSFDHQIGTSTAAADMSYRLAVGYDQTESGFELNERGNMTGSKAAITHDFRLSDGTGLSGSKTALFKIFDYGGSKTDYTLDQLWFDLDIVVNFETQHYWVFDDGVNVGGRQNFNAKPGGGTWSASDFYGWSLGVNIVDGYAASSVDNEKWTTAVTMIDRAAWTFALSDRLSDASMAGMPTDDFIVTSFKHKAQVDSISQVELEIADDDNGLALPQLYSGRPDWRIQVFRDSDYRPIFSSLISAVEFDQSAKGKTKEIAVKGRDPIGEMDFAFPYFDIGQYEAMPSAISGYRRYEVEAYSRAFHLGAVSLLTLNQFVGLDKFSVGNRGEYLPRYDQRMRLYSGHPIQVYNNEEVNGPDNVEDAWEVSRVIDHFRPDPVDSTKTLAVLRDDYLPWSDDQLPHNITLVVKGMWRNNGSSGTYSTLATLDEDVERGYITLGAQGQTNTAHNAFRGAHTALQRETVLVANASSGATTVYVDDTSLFPSSGTLIFESSGTHTYTGKTANSFTGLSPGLLSNLGAGTSVQEPTSINSGFIIDVEWERSLILRKIENSGGYLKLTMAQGTAYPMAYEAQDIQTTNTNGSGDSALAKNPLILSDVGNEEKVRVYIQVNALGTAAGLGDFESKVYESSDIVTNTKAGSTQIAFVTTDTIASLPASIQALIPNPGDSVGTTSTDYGDGMEGDLAYMSFPKITAPNIYNVNVGNGYVYRDSHARWVRDLAQSLWFQKTFGVIRKQPYDLNGLPAKTTLAAAFDAATDTEIALTETAWFPYSGVCEVWSHDPEAATAEPATMLTSFAYVGKDIATGELTNVMFADSTQGTIATTAPGSLGSRYVVCRSISGDYKHMFALFADMRNDGSADADGGTRKEDFGLLYPVAENYKVSVVWAETGQRFSDLKVGQDCDLWSISAKNDPAGTAYTGSAKPWSSNPTATMIDYAAPRLIGQRSNTTELHSHLQSWEDKAGAFVLVDLSKFFNLNTEANNGRCFQNAGGNKPLGQLLVDQPGFPTLMDSYWFHAASNYQNSESPIPEHPNQNRWVDAKTTLTIDVLASNPVGSLAVAASASDTYLNVGDHTAFPLSSTAGLLGASDTFGWTGKGGSIGAVEVAYTSSLNNLISGAGTWTLSGGSGTGATGSYDRIWRGATPDVYLYTGGSGYGANKTGTWTCDQNSRHAGTWTSNGSGVITSIAYNRSFTTDFSTNGLTFTINGSGTGAEIRHDAADLQPKPGNFSVTNGGVGYQTTDTPTLTLSTLTGTGYINYNFTINEDQLTGVTGVGSAHPVGTAVTLNSTMDTIFVESTADFPTKLGVGAFINQNTAGKIEAKTTDANGNEATLEYVFSYTGKTATSFTGVRYRPVRQGETVDVAASGLWASDSYTVHGVPSMLKDGTVIRASLGSAFPMGFMLAIDGFVKTPNSGTFFEHDKIRVMQMSALFSDWFKQVNVPALSDINNVPILHDFNVDGATDGTGTVESFGSILDARNKSYLATLRTMAGAAGVGDGGSLLTLNFQMGRDNRLEFRPTFNAGHSLTRNNLKVSQLKSSKASTFTNVRVLYNGGLSFVDYPQLTYRGNHRFRFVDAIDVASYDQALNIAKQEYQKRKEAAFSVEAEIIRESNESQRDGPMLANARYGYIADPARQSVGPYGGYWSALRGGSPFPGVCNAMHGNISGYGLLDTTEYGSPRTLGIGIGGYAGAADFTTTYGESLALYPTNRLYTCRPWEQFFYWYGAASVSYAVQIVHVPKGMPKVSETTGNELRVFISDEASSLPVTGRLTDNVADKLFGIHLGDYTFSEAYSGSHTPSLWSEQRGIESITVKGNGYFEIDVPASYWAAGNAAGYKMVLSVNADYLSALARHKCGDDFGGNAITTPVGSAYAGQTKPTFPNSNEFSIFPLGIRTYPEMGAYADERSMWYAPRIHVTDDINFVPGTYAAYTDDHLSIDETMFIQAVTYEYSPKKLDRTVLKMERDLGRMPLGIEGYLATNPFNDTGGQGPPAGGGGGSTSNPTSGRSSGGGYALPPPTSWPGGYTGGQTGTSPGASFPPLRGMESGDLGGVSGPSLGGANFQRLNTDTGVQQDGQFNAQGLTESNINHLSDSVVSRLTGSLNLDSMLPGSVLSIPGQPTPSVVVPKQRAMEGVDTKFLSSQGQATPTDDGWMLPGASQLDDSEAVTNLAHGVKMQATMPKDVAHPVVGIEAFISCDLGPASNKTISLTTTMTCPDTGESISHTYEETIASSISRKSVQLLPTQFFSPAATEGRNITVEIVRKPNQGNDDADYSAVVINGIQVTNTVHNNQGRTQSSDLLPFSGDSLNTTDTTGYSLSLNSDADPLA